MILNISIGLLFYLISICKAATSNANVGGISFPEEGHKDPTKQNAANKQPVTNFRCKDGEFLYPGDQEDDWVCDCRPGYIYHPSTNKCYAAYTKGPCNDQQFLVLERPNVIPECQYNQCQDKHVLYKGACHQLNTAGPCPSQTLGNVLEIDETSLKIGCSLGETEAEVKAAKDREFLASRIDFEDSTTPKDGVFPYKACFYGGIRPSTHVTCPKTNETDASSIIIKPNIPTTIYPNV
ncbi:uncharacterized protein LOC116337432 [Contarinia nasturtii]|uniref:uncharacterized protein LOC116337432 n=1 Tax=Contarinia nasturtii TaxID=265458 RepID=UPI0012D42593|nr:uncharacterized protein LOC116337432 [Contarinia nasturtii]